MPYVPWRGVVPRPAEGTCRRLPVVLKESVAIETISGVDSGACYTLEAAVSNLDLQREILTQ